MVLVQHAEVYLAASVTTMLYHSGSRWLFCGLSDGQIKAYRQEPSAESTLLGHTAPVTALLIHTDVLLSGAEDSTIRLWRYDDVSGDFRCLATVQNAAGAVL